MSEPTALSALQQRIRGNAAKEQLLTDLRTFLDGRGESQLLQNLPKSPAIDWLQLYDEVVRRGGYAAVCDRKAWQEVKTAVNADVMPYQLASHYHRFLYAFEEKQLFGRDVPLPSTTKGVKRSPEQLATIQDLQQASNGTGTPLPTHNKRLKVAQPPDFGSLKGLLLALDSNAPKDSLRAVSILTALSYGSSSQEEQDPLLLDMAPELLDALYRQICSCQLLADNKSTRDRLLNTRSDVGQEELQRGKALLLLNILRNLSMQDANQRHMALHDDLLLLLMLLLRKLGVGTDEIGDHALDILCNVGKKIDFLKLNPHLQVHAWHPNYNLSAHLWQKDDMLPLELLLQQCCRLVKVSRRRSVVLRALELLTSSSRNPSLRPLLAQSASLQDEGFFHRLVSLLAVTPMDFDAHRVDGESEEEMEDDEDSSWPAPWDVPMASGVGLVYVNPEGEKVGQGDDAIDHEVRDAALEVLFRLSDAADAKMRLAQHPFCLQRIAMLLTSCIGRPEAARMAVATLSNVSMDRRTFPYFVDIEQELALAACADKSVADILNNVMADVYGMHSL